MTRPIHPHRLAQITGDHEAAGFQPNPGWRRGSVRPMPVHRLAQLTGDYSAIGAPAGATGSRSPACGHRPTEGAGAPNPLTRFEDSLLARRVGVGAMVLSALVTLYFGAQLLRWVFA